MQLIEEIFSGKSKCAFFFICIGKKFQNTFKKTTFPFYKEYCKKYDIGIILINDFIDKNYNKYSLYKKDPGYQRLLAPGLIKENFPKYKYICDIDVDCIPGFLSRNIFKYCKNIKKNEICLVKPNPPTFDEPNLGKRLSLLRKLYLDKNYPLDSIVIAPDKIKSKMFGYSYTGPVATIGTCLGTTDILAKTGNKFYKDIILDKQFEYLQTYRINYYSKNLKIKWLPYEFQATWSYEISAYFPFLFKKIYRKYFYECIMATLHRVDFLHFAGSWPENLFFFKLSYKKKGKLKKYYDYIAKYLHKNIKAKSYGRIKYKKKFKI